MNGEIAIPAGHPATEGHFPGMPIVPGAVLLAEIAAALDIESAPLHLRDAKFLRPVPPGEHLQMTALPVEGGMKFEVFLADGALALSGMFLRDHRG